MYIPHYSIHRIMRKWVKESGVKDCSFWVRCPSDNAAIVDVYSTRPGFLIGYHGRLVNKYRDAIKEEVVKYQLGGQCEIEIQMHEVDRVR